MTQAISTALRGLASRKGEKLRSADSVLLIRAAVALEESERARSVQMGHFREMLGDIVDLRIELSTMREVIGAVMHKDDPDDPRSV
jgi:hypothetical protein